MGRLVIPFLCFGTVLLGCWLFQRNSFSNLSFCNSSLSFIEKPCHCHVHKAFAERGSRLLHSWTDEELFERAVAADKHRKRIAESNSPQTHMSQDRQVTQPSLFNVSAQLPSEFLFECWQNFSRDSKNKPRPKIAFLFLTTGDLPFALLWNKFFDGHDQLFNVYVHLDPYEVNLFNRNSGVFWGRLVPAGRTHRGTPSLIAAARRLLANALLDDPLNKHFAVISDHCIPLRDFKNVYKQVTKSRKSFMEIIDNSPLLHSRYTARGEDVMLPEVPFSKFRVGSQFFIVIRKHALMIVSDKKYWKKFSLPCLNPNSCYAEEHYFPTLMEMQDPGGATRFTVTSVDWSTTVGGHPRSYKKNEINKELIESLQTAQDGRFLFARKFDDDCADVLMQHSALLLR